MRLLLVEDDRDLAEVLEAGLTEMGYQVDLAHDGLLGEQMALEGGYDVLVVDWGLPRQDGRTLVHRLRARKVDCPILMLTAYTDVQYRVEGLDAGADDYLTKPFSFDELFARLRAITRRQDSKRGDQHLSAGPLSLDPRRRVAMLDGRPLDIRPKEFSLLELLLERKDAVVTRTIIAEQVWGTTFGVTDDVINMTVSSLRKTITEMSRKAGVPVTIRTVRGVGYALAFDGVN